MRKKNILACILICIFAICGCSNQAIEGIYNSDAKIAEDYDTYNLVNYKGKQVNENYKVSAGKIEGMYTVWKCDAGTEKELEITYQVSVDSGKMKLVFIDAEGGLETLAEVSEESETKDGKTVHVVLKEGKNRLKAVALKGTKMDMELTIANGEFGDFD